MSPHSSSEDLEEYIGGKLSSENSSLVQTHLDGCEQCQHRLAEIALQVRWKDTERRSEPRIPVNFSGRLKLLDPLTSVGPPHDVDVIEISRNGLKIRTTRYLIPKSLIQIRFGGKGMLGEVRYCVKTESEYHAGIKQVQDFPSS